MLAYQNTYETILRLGRALLRARGPHGARYIVYSEAKREWRFTDTLPHGAKLAF